MTDPESEGQSLDDDVVPTSIQRDGDAAITIAWSDGAVSRWTAAQLRKICPCATCREKKRGNQDQKADSKSLTLPVLSAAEARPLSIDSMRPVGSYAYNIAFSDGHSSGIYPFALLYRETEPSGS
jgi:DUF971 family protein